jgi:hypothetical protein
LGVAVDFEEAYNNYGDRSQRGREEDERRGVL